MRNEVSQRQLPCIALFLCGLHWDDDPFDDRKHGELFRDEAAQDSKPDAPEDRDCILDNPSARNHGQVHMEYQ